MIVAKAYRFALVAPMATGANAIASYAQSICIAIGTSISNCDPGNA
jgi:hypothetical protein